MKSKQRSINRIFLCLLILMVVILNGNFRKEDVSCLQGMFGALTIHAAEASPVREQMEQSILTGKVGEAELFSLEPEEENETSAVRIASEADSAGVSAAESADSRHETGSLVMANVNNTLNVRKEPDETSEKIGYLYADCGGIILEHRDGWTKLESGELIGWASDQYLLFGEEAKEEVSAVGRTIACVTGDTLRIRKEPSTDAKIFGLAAKGEKYEVLGAAELEFSSDVEFGEGWAAVDFEGQTGYISAEYVEISFEYDTGETLEQIREREEEEKRAEILKNSKVQTEAVRANAGGIPAGTSDIVLLAALVQCEAGGESYEGQLAVASVVANRVRSAAYPNTVSGVIFASGQFTPAGSGKLARVIERGSIKQSCLQAATEALAGVTNIGGATRFRRAGNRAGIIIGNHVFW